MAAWETHGSDRAGWSTEGARDPAAWCAARYARPKRHHPCIPALLILLLASSYGCGGGSSAFVQPPPPPAPDFSVIVSSSNISLMQGGTSSPITLMVNPLNGFSGTVQVTLAGLPAGVTSSPASPFSLQVGSSAQVFFEASANAPAGSVTVTTEASSGNLSHSASFSLAVQPGVVQSLPRTTYCRTDALAALNDPPGEPHHRHIAYDSANQHVFFANRAMNRVEVLSSIDGTSLASIPLAGASGVDISADGKTVWAGTVTGQVAAVDTSTLQVRSLATIPALQLAPNISYDRPEEAIALSNGKLFLRVRQASGSQALAALWDPASASLTNLTSTAPALFQNGVGVVARSGDHTRVLVTANDSSGEIAVFDASGTVVAGPVTLGAGKILYATANQDASRFAVVFSSGGTTQIRLLDGGLNPIGAYVAGTPLGVVFSRDSQQLFVTESIAGAPLVTVLSGADLHLIGRVPDLAIQGSRSEIEDADETQMLFGISNRGVTLVDAAHPGSLPATAPTFAAAPAVEPSEGPNSGGTGVFVSGQNFESTAQLKFGSQLAANVQVASAAQIQATSPANTTTGAVSVTSYFPSGWMALAPDAFSYGPQILKILPNAGNKAAGDSVSIYGYGFGPDSGKLSVKIGGLGATVQKVENVTSIAPSLGLDTSFPFPLERITVVTPSGTPGAADVTVTSADGTATMARGFQFLQSVQVYSKAGFYKFLLYDRMRQRVYLSNIDHVDVFDLNTAQFRSPIEPPGGPPPNAQLRGLALTPDGSQLVVADFGAQSIYLMNPDLASGSSVSVGGLPGFVNSGPVRVAATGTQTVFVALAPVGTTGGCTVCVAQMNLAATPPTIQAAPQAQASTLSGPPLLQSSADGTHVYLSFGSSPGGPLATWDSSSPDQFATVLANAGATDLAAAGDGTQFAVRSNSGTEIRSSALNVTSVAAAPELEQIPSRTEVPGIAMHPTGALLYEPFLTGPAPSALPIAGVQGGIDIVDAHTGQLRLRVLLPEPFAMLSTDVDALHAGFLAIDENGQRLFALTASGLTVVQLAEVPLGIGSINPLSGPAAGGTLVTIRGSGFQSGTTLSIGGKLAAVTFKDMNTLTFSTPSLSTGPQQIVLTNPNGESYSLDAAFLAQ